MLLAGHAQSREFNDRFWQRAGSRSENSCRPACAARVQTVLSVLFIQTMIRCSWPTVHWKSPAEAPR
eukprot:15436001-Alexandrium_andersonii.AAC.1